MLACGGWPLSAAANSAALAVRWFIVGVMARSMACAVMARTAGLSSRTAGTRTPMAIMATLSGGVWPVSSL